MAYNSLNGKVQLPEMFFPKNSLGKMANNADNMYSIVSASMFKGDGTELTGIPRVINSNNNGLVTNINGDENTFYCEPNLTFDSATKILTVNEGRVNAGFFSGDGSFLTGIARGSEYDVQFRSPIGQLTGSSNLQIFPNQVKLNAGFILPRKRVQTNYSIISSDYIIGVDTSTTLSSFEVYLPDASLLESGQTFIVKHEIGNLDDKAIIVIASGSQTIDGSKNAFLLVPHSSINIYCDGSQAFYIY